jgi:hypothetical protein
LKQWYWGSIEIELSGNTFFSLGRLVSEDFNVLLGLDLHVKAAGNWLWGGDVTVRVDLTGLWGGKTDTLNKEGSVKKKNDRYLP